MMTIQEVAKTMIRKEPAIKFPLKMGYAGDVWDAKSNRVLDIRGWGHLQYADDGKGAELQDSIGAWVVETLNTEAKRLGLI